MKKSDESGMRDEYDFSGARKLRHVSRLSEGQRRELLRNSATLDAQYWFGHALRRVQELEARIVAYLSLVLDRAPEAAGDAAIALFEGHDDSVLSLVVSGTSVPGSPEFETRLRRVRQERSWLVHKGGLATSRADDAGDGVTELVQRLESLATDATVLAGELQATLQEHLANEGLTIEEARRRTEEAIHHWTAA